MKTVKIINGAYGQRLGGKTRSVRLGETCRVDDQEAVRLIGLKVAEYVEEEPESVPPAPLTIDIDESGGISEPPRQDDEVGAPEPTRQEPRKSTKTKKTGRSGEASPPDLAPEDPVV